MAYIVRTKQGQSIAVLKSLACTRDETIQELCTAAKIDKNDYKNHSYYNCPEVVKELIKAGY